MTTTIEWAQTHGVCIEATVPFKEQVGEPCPRSVEEIAIRSIILHTVAAVGYRVDSKCLVDWLKDQQIWDYVSPLEKTWFTAKEMTNEERRRLGWRIEAEWTLLWSISKVQSLGLPTQTCNTATLVDDIMPKLDDPIATFIASAKLRSSSALWVEDNRVYNLHCYARQAFKSNTVPDDLIYDVLVQRHYAFEWLHSRDEWDDIRLDT
ncbi:DUF4272 domain-containing protein [Acaryochloris marina]|uniref:DUF4272 domain-containing protein n=1 Tax=Acaryochloris marina TaxID=155978 RepID=UPI0007C49AD7|nr:DUF4272 domain-containing protein [Acaryochloris marina]BDM77168.1 hypothetical protein AM10699_00420 [Acaryochloris marina MBIC10699]